MPPAQYRPVADVAYVTARPERTIRNWAAAGRVPRLEHHGTIYVDLVAAAALSSRTARRNRTTG